MATSSASGVLLSASSLSGYKDQIQQYLTDYRKSLETASINPLNVKKDTYTSQKNSLSDLATKLTSLQSTLGLLTATGSNSLFNSFSSSISSTNYVNPILTGTLSPGNYSILVKQLAKNDKIVSDSVAQNGPQILSVGDHEFTVNVGSTSFTVNFSVEAGDTNTSILEKIAIAINKSSASAKLTASILNDTDDTTKLILVSKETGSSNALSFDDPDGVLASLGINSNRTAVVGSSGGYVNVNIDDLDSIVNIDGLDIKRGTNSVAGVIPGLTLDLRTVNQASDIPTNLIIAPGKDNVKALLDKFMEDYNDVIKHINEQVKTSSSGAKSVFSGDITLRSLTLQMRSLLNQSVGSVATGTPSSLFSIGIKINQDGSLVWDDITKFNQAFEKGATNISNIFNSADGLANSLSSYLNNYTRAGGILYNKSLSIQNQIKSIESRVLTAQFRIDKRVDRVTMSYNNLMSSITNLQNQQEMMRQVTQGMY